MFYSLLKGIMISSQSESHSESNTSCVSVCVVRFDFKSDDINFGYLALMVASFASMSCFMATSAASTAGR